MTRGLELRRLFKEFNTRYWDGRLPQYRVRCRRLPALHGLCDPRRHTILIDPRVAESRRVLLHEKCHVAAAERDGLHGKGFQNELARLAEAGEAWAEEERAMYADPTRRILATRRTVRDFMEEMANGSEAVMTWAKARVYVAHFFGMSAPGFSRRYRSARATWLRLQRAAITDRAMEAALRKKISKERGVQEADLE